MRRAPLFALLCLAAAAAPAPTAVEDAQLALRLAAYARRTGDADAMLAAAGMLAGSALHEARIEGGRLVAGKPSTLAADLGVEARMMTPGDARIAAVASAIGAARSKGIAGGGWGRGPMQMSQRLAPGGRIGWTVAARAGEPALVSAVGDGDARIALLVTDVAGRPVCRAADDHHYPLCRWAPARAARYRVQVANGGGVPTDVVILSN